MKYNNFCLEIGHMLGMVRFSGSFTGLIMPTVYLTAKAEHNYKACKIIYRKCA